MQVMRMSAHQSIATLAQPKPGPNYVCHRCGVKGHYIKFCPTNGDQNFDPLNKKIKRSSGIPTSLLQPVSFVSEQDKDKIVELPSGQLAKRVEDVKDFQATVSAFRCPKELCCNLCFNAPRLAVLTRCCNLSFCFDCISRALQPPENRCPKCGRSEQYVHTVVPNLRLRKIVDSFASNTFRPFVASYLTPK